MSNPKLDSDTNPYRTKSEGVSLADTAERAIRQIANWVVARRAMTYVAELLEMERYGDR